MTDTLTMERYLTDPLHLCGAAELSLDDVASEIHAVASASRLTVWRRLKRLAQALSARGPRFSLHLTRSLSARAYMKDRGDVFFSVGAILSRSPVVTLSVFCHEYAHLSLSYEAFYPALKELNRQFKDTFSHIPHADLLSPIELCAMVRAVDLMERMQKSVARTSAQKKLALLIRTEKEKLSYLESQLKALK